MIENVRKFFIMKSGLGSRIGVPAGLIECCLSLWLPAQSLGAHSWMGVSLAVMDFNESVRACPKKFFQVVEEHTREDRERGSQGFSRWYPFAREAFYPRPPQSHAWRSTNLHEE